jgi:hypothetical protein
MYKISVFTCSNVAAKYRKILETKEEPVRDLSAARHQETESLSLLAKMEVAKGHSSAALDLMEKAVTLDLGDSKNIFNTGGVKPETTSEFCTWNLTDLNLLASGAPHDWRPQVLLGLYYPFFAKFEESYYPQAGRCFPQSGSTQWSNTPHSISTG